MYYLNSGEPGNVCPRGSCPSTRYEIKLSGFATPSNDTTSENPLNTAIRRKVHIDRGN